MAGDKTKPEAIDGSGKQPTSRLLEEHNAIIDSLTKQVTANQAVIGNDLAKFAKDDMDSGGTAPGVKAEELEHIFDSKVRKSGETPINQLALEAMARELFLQNAAGLQQAMDKIQSLDAPGSHDPSQKLFEEFRNDVIALAKSAKSGVHQLAPHILVAKKNSIPKVDVSDLVIALPHSRVPAADGAIVVAADRDVRAHIGGGGTLVIGGVHTKLTSDGAKKLPPGTQVYRHGIKDEK